MNEMIERAVNAAFAVLGDDWKREGDEAWCEPGDIKVQGFDVRAVVAAVVSTIRVPNEAMLDVYMDECSLGGDLIGKPGETVPETVARIFGAMIDAGLK